jgi:cytochrome c553
MDASLGFVGRVRSIIFAVLTLSASTLYACGGSQPAPAEPSAPVGETPAPAPTATDGAGAAAPAAPKETASAEVSFASLPKDKKVEVMMNKVMPNVGKLFKEHDAKEYGSFSCATCHGPQKNQDPHKVLPKLTLSNGGYEKLAKAKPEVTKFMAEKVVPAMAEALGEKPFDPATKQGFGCAGCHAVD